MYLSNFSDLLLFSVEKIVSLFQEHQWITVGDKSHERGDLLYHCGQKCEFKVPVIDITDLLTSRSSAKRCPYSKIENNDKQFYRALPGLSLS